MPGKAVLSDEKLAGLVQSVGFSRTRKHKGYREDATAVAIILAESGGDANAHNDNSATRDNSYGLFQINLYGDLRDERAERYGLRSNANLFEPKRNAEIAYDLFKRRGNQFTDWSVYNNGSYLLKMPRALKAVQSPDTDLPTISGAIEGALSDAIPEPLQGVVQAFAFLTDPSNWQRVALFVGGGVIIIVGIAFLANESGAVGAAVKAVPVGRAATKAAKRIR